MSKLTISPDMENYGIIFKENVIANSLNYGSLRIRQDINESSIIVNCQWTLNLSEYTSICTFFSNNAGIKFQIDLILLTSELLEYDVNLIPSSFVLIYQVGGVYKVKASFEVLPNLTILDAQKILVSARSITRI